MPTSNGQMAKAANARRRIVTTITSAESAPTGVNDGLAVAGYDFVDVQIGLGDCTNFTGTPYVCTLASTGGLVAWTQMTDSAGAAVVYTAITNSITVRFAVSGFDRFQFHVSPTGAGAAGGSKVMTAVHPVV